jgi:hypothetical protein
MKKISISGHPVADFGFPERFPLLQQRKIVDAAGERFEAPGGMTPAIERIIRFKVL